jgi:hypothetical protein
MIWTIGQFPELDHLKPAERAALLARVPRWTYPLLIAGSLVQGLLLGGLAFAYTFWMARSYRLATLTGVVVAAAAAAALYLRQLGRVRAEMRGTLADAFIGQRPPFCFECGYDLRASNETRCPECGATISGE